MHKVKKKKPQLTPAQMRRYFSFMKAKDKKGMEKLKEQGILPKTYQGHKVY